MSTLPLPHTHIQLICATNMARKNGIFVAFILPLVGSVYYLTLHMNTRRLTEKNLPELTQFVKSPWISDQIL